MLSPEQIQQARQQYGIGTAPSGSGFGSRPPVDHAARMQRLRSIASPSSQTQKEESGGFIKNLAKDIARPFVKAGVTGVSAIHSAGDLLLGNQAGAEKALQGYDVPGFGHVTPAKIGTDVQDQMNGQGAFGENTLKTIGTGAEIASTLAGGEGAGGLVESAGKTAVKDLALQGAKEGAVIGATGGFGSGAQEEGATAGSLAKSTLGGAALGGALGAATGAVSPLLSKEGRSALKASKTASAAKKAEKEILAIVSPELSKAEKATAIASGRGTEGGFLKGSKLVPTDREKEMSQAVLSVVNPKKDLVSNVNATRKAIGKEADSVIKSLKEAQISYSPNAFKESLGEIEKPITLSGDERLNKMYDLATDRFMKFIDKNDKDLSGLLQSRKEFDTWLEKQLPKVWEDSSVRPLHQALRDVRGAANEFIASRLPNGSPFLDSLRKQNLMYEAIDNMSDKAVKELGGNVITKKVTEFTKKHPLASKAIGAAVGGGVVGSILKE